MVSMAAVPAPVEQNAEEEYAPAGGIGTPSKEPGTGAAAGGANTAAITAMATATPATVATAAHRPSTGRRAARRASRARSSDELWPVAGGDASSWSTTGGMASLMTGPHRAPVSRRPPAEWYGGGVGAA